MHCSLWNHETRRLSTANTTEARTPRAPVRMRAFTGMRSLFAWTKPHGFMPLCRQRRSEQRGLFSTTNVGGTSTPIHRRDAGNIGRRDGRSLRDASDTQSHPAWQPDNRSRTNPVGRIGSRPMCGVSPKCDQQPLAGNLERSLIEQTERRQGSLQLGELDW